MNEVVLKELDYLSHHGIKGQKWGERNYQNPDGTLTPEGKLRYRKDDMTSKEYKAAKAYAKAKKFSDAADSYEKKYFRTRNLHEVAGSDALRTRQVRNLKKFDKRYAKLSDESKKIVDKAVKDIGKQTISSLSPESINRWRKAVRSNQIMHFTLGPIAGAIAGSVSYNRGNKEELKETYKQGQYKTDYKDVKKWPHKI